jgi:hypothetical protein
MNCDGVGTGRGGGVSKIKIKERTLRVNPRHVPRLADVRSALAVIFGHYGPSAPPPPYAGEGIVGLGL